MTNFRTEIFLNGAPFEIIPGEGIMLIGSCFAENIGQKFSEARFSPCVNPFGVLFNPFSVVDTLNSILEKRFFAPSDLIFDGQLWHSYFHHGSFSGNNMDKMLAHINHTVEVSHNELLNADHLFITLGTAWVYQEKESGHVVANCHKFPDSMFNRFRLTSNEVCGRLKSVLSDLKSVNPKINIVLTVSPVRHWKDTAYGNQLSKAVLLLAIDEICQEFDFISYFPAYELVLDDLRDYRFYADDMVHPNTLAINYVWSKLQDFCFGTKARMFIKGTTEIENGLRHKPFHPNTTQHKIFLEGLLKKIDSIENLYPRISLLNDRACIEKRIREIAID
ncbi:MAG: GSCFA domain-containing protein [Breznakibacter sp.]